MSLYADRILPILIDLSMHNKRLQPYRERIVGAAEGRVLEVGIGSGFNLPFYPARVQHVIGLDPSPHLLAMARQIAPRTTAPVAFVESSAEAIPFDDASIDTIVTTWTLCSIPNAPSALGEMRRVLKPGGRRLFVEHGRAPDSGVRWWQDRLTRCGGALAAAVISTARSVS
jgi:ubiquinone/menaquinone biosynthesis C-methylase UbiE